MSMEPTILLAKSVDWLIDVLDFTLMENGKQKTWLEVSSVTNTLAYLSGVSAT
jgi:hypothetical protein